MHPGAEARRQLATTPGDRALAVCREIEPEVLAELAHWLEEHGPVFAGPGGPEDREKLLHWSRLLRELP